jgi:hypothetical protein
MAKRDDWLRELGPESFFSQPKLDLPKWTLGIIPGPAPADRGVPGNSTPEKIQEFSREMQDHFDEWDRTKKEYLIQEWCQFLGAEAPADALWKLGEKMGYPAFAMPDKQQQGPRPSGDSGVARRKTLANDIRVAVKVDHLKKINPKEFPDDDSALRKVLPKLKHNRAELKSWKNLLGRIRTMYKKMGSSLFKQ